MAKNKTFTFQTHYLNTCVAHALKNTIDFSESGDRYTQLLAKIQNTPYTQVDLSAEETHALLEALLTEMNTYVSVTQEHYTIKD
jgi:hypothetical protein